jgi:predicted enzyme related to lactoylglutathione lyase
MLTPLTRSVLFIAVSSGILSAQSAGTGPASTKEKVTGIGGFFYRAADPAALAKWYEEHLGIPPVPTTYEVEPWRQEAGYTVFAAFQANTKYFGDSTKTWMMNFRVRSLDAMVAQLRRAGIEVEVDPETYPNGRFARLKDPEGNPIQLWEFRNPRG